ncbi:MAG TPA: proline racemase family protein, partial [Verrucomicrobiae bacterium]|nr:proline racemase family protein [Verrucomicrobiae bacterium]
QRLERFRRQHDSFRSAVVNEPRGSDVLVGALLLEPSDAACICAAIFFNNVGCLGMCGHGTIGLMTTLHHLGRVQPGEHRIETPVGIVTATLHPDGSVSVQNVPSYRKSKQVTIQVPGLGAIQGDVAWGGNWFFLVKEHPWALEISNVEELTNRCWALRRALNAEQFPEVDHIELFGPAQSSSADARNFVLCPGKAYDRSPCGTGTSAKLACLYEDGELRAGAVWRQESITGSIFEGTVTVVNGEIIPTIRGTAFVNAEATLLLNTADPCCWGIPGSHS